MAVLSKGHTFANGDQVTAAKLNNLADDATFTSGAVDNISTQLSGGGIIVKDGGVSTAKLGDNAVTTIKITDSNVTKAKIENVADMKVLGNTSGSATAPQEVSVLDEDDMSSDSATAIATQQSIKAYVDGMRPKYVALTGGTRSLSSGNTSGTFTHTFNIADFTSGNSDFGTEKITGILIRGFAAASGDSSRVRATLPNGTFTDITRSAAFGSGDSVHDSSTFTLPINAGQSSFQLYVKNDYFGAANYSIVGAIILPNL